MTIFHLLFIPSPGLSHLASTVEAVKLLLHRDPRLSITVLIMNSANNQTTHNYLQNSKPGPTTRLKFVNLPAIDGSPSPFQSINGHAVRIREIVSDLIEKPPEPDFRVAGLVVDMFCTKFIEIGDELGLPSYVFFTSGASALGVMSHLVRLMFEENKDLSQYKNSRIELAVSCFSSPIPAKALPAVFIEGGPLSAMFLDYFKRVSGARGVMVNTFHELEPLAIPALQDGRIPRIYPVGPILTPGPDVETMGTELKDWLDGQPDGSVVFLCFGTMGSFEPDQTREIAAALEGSGARFLWSLRKPGPEKGPAAMPAPTEYEDFREVLPEGFLERTKGVGKVIGWAPQMVVLAHRAVGGFVSHCGWNSTLESVWHGVPVATLPLYAEQQLNAFLLVKELGMAEAIRVDYRREFGGGEMVGAAEIEAAIRRLMAEESGVREKVREMQRKSRAALEEGGSSYEALTRFIEDVIRNVNG